MEIELRGPWNVKPFLRAHGTSAVELHGFQVKDAQGVVVAETYPAPWPVRVDAVVATAIAALPDTLAALKTTADLLESALDHIWGDDAADPDCVYVAGVATARAAVAKAEGRAA